MLACGFDEAIESAVLLDIGEIDLLPAKSDGACTGEPMDAIDGAEGGDVEAGTLARYSAPELGELMLAILLRFFVSMLVGDRSLLRSSSVRVRGRDELLDDDMVYAASPLRSLAER